MSESRPLVSVIVPVHNAETTLRRCVQSIVGQSYANLEIILVENASQDGSLALCGHFEREEDRLSVISLSEPSVSYARNAGMEASTGEYLAFCDADDWYKNRAIETMVDKAQRFDAEVVKAGYEKVISPWFPFKLRRSYTQIDAVSCRGDWAYRDYMRFYNPLNYPYNNSMCCSLYARNIMMSRVPRAVRCNGLRRGEDMLVDACACERAKRTVTIPDVLYCYRLGGVTSTVERIVQDSLAYKRNLDDFVGLHFPYDQARLDWEFSCYLVESLLKRFQNSVALDKEELVSFYASCCEVEGVRESAQTVIDCEDSASLVVEAARLFIARDAGGLYEFAKSRYMRRRAILKTASFLGANRA